MNGTTQIISPAVYQSLPPASKMLWRSFSFYAEHWHVIVGIALIPILIAGPNILFGEYIPALAILITVLAAVVGFLARLAMFNVVAEEGDPAGGIIGAYKNGWQILIPFVWVSALLTLTTLGGFFLFIVPGVLLSIWLSMSFYAFIIEGQRGVSALTASWYYVKGYWLPVFWRFLFLGIIVGVAGLLINFVVAVPSFFVALEHGTTGAPEYSPLGQLINLLFNHAVASPLYIIYAYILYQSLRAVKNKTPPVENQTQLKNKVITFMVIGAIGILALTIFAGFFLSRLVQELIASSAPDAVITSPSSFASLGISTLLGFFLR